MQPLHFRDAGIVSTAVLLSVGLALAGCSSSGTSSKPSAPASTPASSPSSTSSAPSNSSEPSSGAGAISAIETNWAKFFSAKTPVNDRIALLENGSEFATVIKTQLSSALASAASAKVTHVSLTGTNQAAVSYNILLNGKTALGGQTGEAVYQDSVWKVGDTSFCALLTLEAGGSKSGLPAGCKG